MRKYNNMNWYKLENYTKQAQSRIQVVNRGEDRRVYDIIDRLKDFNLPEDPEWSLTRIATVGIKEFDEQGEEVAENFFMDVASKAELEETTGYSMARDLCRILTQMDRDGRPIDRFADPETDEEEFETDEDLAQKEQTQRNYMNKMRSYL